MQVGKGNASSLQLNACGEKLEKINRAVGFIFSRCGLPRKRKNIAGKKELLAVKMRNGWGIPGKKPVDNPGLLV
jgi:hypothetical protein